VQCGNPVGTRGFHGRAGGGAEPALRQPAGEPRRRGAIPRAGRRAAVPDTPRPGPSHAAPGGVRLDGGDGGSRRGNLRRSPTPAARPPHAGYGDPRIGEKNPAGRGGPEPRSLSPIAQRRPALRIVRARFSDALRPVRALPAPPPGIGRSPRASPWSN